MNTTFIEKAEQCLHTVTMRRHQLLIVCEVFGEEQVKQIATTFHYPYLNLNLLVSDRLKDVPVRRRPHHVHRIVSEAIRQTGENTVCLDHIELLFSPSLQQHPVKLFEDLSRYAILVVSWKGTFENDMLVYAQPGHPEYFRSPIDGIVLSS